MDLIWNELNLWTIGLLTILLLTALTIWGNLLYEGAKGLWDLEETFASKKNEGWNPAKTSAVFLIFLVLMQVLTLYNIISGAAEPLLEDGKIDHWTELYKVEETFEHLESYDEEEWYIRWQISGFLERGMMETGLLALHTGLLFQSIYRGNRKIRLTEKGLYTHEGKRKISKIECYRVSQNSREEGLKLSIVPEHKKTFWGKSSKGPKKISLAIEKSSLRAAEEVLRLADVKKEETI